MRGKCTRQGNSSGMKYLSWHVILRECVISNIAPQITPIFADICRLCLFPNATHFCLCCKLLPKHVILKEKMENRGLLFIPDISGFTKFVNETDIEHSRLIIQELLELLINANRSGLEISEIEGDAILFYKFGPMPDVKEVFRQVEEMFCAFHSHLANYDNVRFCQCKACRSAIHLTLKIITHYGEFTGYHVRNFNKLIGRDVIVAHQLLKNDIDQHEYWLITKDLLEADAPPGLAGWMQWSSGAKQTESGEIAYQYTQLSPLKNNIRMDDVPKVAIDANNRMITVSATYDADIITVFHASGDFHYRSAWQENVAAAEEVDHFLPRIGTRSRFILKNGEHVLVRASSYSFQPDRLEFSETYENDGSIIYYTLEKISEHKTKLTLDYYVQKGFLGRFLFKLNKRDSLQASMKRSLQNMHAVVKNIHLPETVD